MTHEYPNIRYEIDEVCATEAAAALIHLAGQGVTRLRLMKLLYLADRESILERGRPICGGHYVSMPHGPVLSDVYNFITEDSFSPGTGYWGEHLENTTSRVVDIKLDPPRRRLSKADQDALRSVHEQHRDRSDTELRSYTHELPEYEDPNGSSSSIAISSILISEGIEPDDAQTLADEVAAQRHYAQLFGN